MNTFNTRFSDPEFNRQANDLRAQRAAATSIRVMRAQGEARAAQQQQEKLQRLTRLAREVASAGRENSEVAEKKVAFYRLEPKTGLRKFLNNKGTLQHATAGHGWI